MVIANLERGVPGIRPGLVTDLEGVGCLMGVQGLSARRSSLRFETAGLNVHRPLPSTMTRVSGRIALTSRVSAGDDTLRAFESAVSERQLTASKGDTQEGFLGRRQLGRSGRCRFYLAVAAMGWSPVIGREISLNGGFLIS
jgi:hypothetical protein